MSKKNELSYVTKEMMQKTRTYLSEHRGLLAEIAANTGRPPVDLNAFDPNKPFVIEVTLKDGSIRYIRFRGITSKVWTAQHYISYEAAEKALDYRKIHPQERKAMYRIVDRREEEICQHL